MAPSNQSQITPERLTQFGFAYAPPLIIGAAVKNKVFDSLATGAKTLEEMSKQSGASLRGLCEPSHKDGAKLARNRLLTSPAQCFDGIRCRKQRRK
jgi:hypothetical protein